MPTDKITIVLLINIGISTLFIALSTSVYSHCGKMIVAIVKRTCYCKGQRRRIEAMLELVSFHENSGKISAEYAGIIEIKCVCGMSTQNVSCLQHVISHQIHASRDL
jgi:hypothetical protein